MDKRVSAGEGSFVISESDEKHLRNLWYWYADVKDIFALFQLQIYIKVQWKIVEENSKKFWKNKKNWEKLKKINKFEEKNLGNFEKNNWEILRKNLGN